MGVPFSSYHMLYIGWTRLTNLLSSTFLLVPCECVCGGGEGEGVSPLLVKVSDFSPSPLCSYTYATTATACVLSLIYRADLDGAIMGDLLLPWKQQPIGQCTLGGGGAVC